MSEDKKNQGYRNDNRNYRRGTNKNRVDNNSAERNVNTQTVDTNDTDKVNPEVKQTKKPEDNRNQFNRQPNRQRSNKDFKKIKVEETIEDIEKDIARIEKEIDLEIKEIMALKLGL